MRKIYAFPSKSAQGGAFLIAGSNIREALLRAEQKTGFRFIMGTTASASGIASCDRRHLEEGDL